MNIPESQKVYDVDSALSFVNDPLEFIDWCSFQNNEGHLVFNYTPGDNIINALNTAVDKIRQYIKKNYLYCVDICTIEWDIKYPLSTAQFIFTLSKNITLNCSIDFIKAIPNKLYHKIIYLPYEIIHEKPYLVNVVNTIYNTKLITDKINVYSFYEIMHWLEYKMRKATFGENKPYNKILVCINKVRNNMYQYASAKPNKDERMAFINAYENGTLRPIDTYGEITNYIDINHGHIRRN